jgi:Skp family chaperone for outer membrane proteins
MNKKYLKQFIVTFLVIVLCMSTFAYAAEAKNQKASAPANITEAKTASKHPGSPDTREIIDEIFEELDKKIEKILKKAEKEFEKYKEKWEKWVEAYNKHKEKLDKLPEWAKFRKYINKFILPQQKRLYIFWKAYEDILKEVQKRAEDRGITLDKDDFIYIFGKINKHLAARLFQDRPNSKERIGIMVASKHHSRPIPINIWP